MLVISSLFCFCTLQWGAERNVVLFLAPYLPPPLLSISMTIWSKPKIFGMLLAKTLKLIFWGQKFLPTSQKPLLAEISVSETNNGPKILREF